MKPWPVSWVRPWVGLWAKAGAAMAKQSNSARKDLAKDISGENLNVLLWRQKGARRMLGHGFISSSIRKNGCGGSEKVASSIEGRRKGGGISRLRAGGGRPGGLSYGRVVGRVCGSSGWRWPCWHWLRGRQMSGCI